MWAGIRSSFSRELRREKEATKSGSGKRKVCVYTYTRNLAFLRPHMKSKSLTDNCTEEQATGINTKKAGLQVGTSVRLVKCNTRLHRM